jgi:hypothetical protein
MNQPVSDKQIKKLFDNKVRCISYDEIQNYRTLRSLLYPYNFCILLFVWDDIPSYNGHWVYVGKYKDKICIFDSLGKDDIDTVSQVSNDVAKRTYQDHPYLSKLIVESKMDLIYNPRQIQQSHSATCARYACYTARNLNKFKTFDDYLKLWTNDKKENDEKILTLTQNYFE